MNIKKYAAECLGTMTLVIIGCGAALFTAANSSGFDLAGVALAFGLVLTIMAFTVGGISGCHINPAVSVAKLVNKEIGVVDFILYIVSQFIGAIIGAAILFAIVKLGKPETVIGAEITLANCSNAFTDIGMWTAMIVEIVLTFIFVLVVMAATNNKKNGKIAGIVVGLALAAVHLVGIGLTGTSVNPARSFGPAIFAGVETLKQVWVFLLAPMVGGILAGVVFRFFIKKADPECADEATANQ